MKNGEQNGLVVSKDERSVMCPFHADLAETNPCKVDPSTGNLVGTHPYVIDPKTGEKKYVMNALPAHWAKMDSYNIDPKTGRRMRVMKALPIDWAKMDTYFIDPETGSMKLGPPYMPCAPIPKTVFC